MKEYKIVVVNQTENNPKPRKIQRILDDWSKTGWQFEDMTFGEYHLAMYIVFSKEQ